MHAQLAWVTQELKECWNGVKQDPWWQGIFMALGLQYEIPPNLAAEANSTPVTTPPRKGNSDPADLDKPSPSGKPSAPKRVQTARPAAIGQPRLDAPVLKPAQKKPPKRETSPEVDDSLLDLMSDAED